jgi:glycogen phosphorylase
LDLRWTWNHEADALWEHVHPALWRQTKSPWTVLQDISAERLAALAEDNRFLAELNDLMARRQAYLDRSTWFQQTYDLAALGNVAYFSMEFGLGSALPLYAGGLGVLAGDFLKTASDLGVPVIGVSLLYQEGYFRQMIDAAGLQHEAYPYNEPTMMPIRPAMKGGSWLRIPLELPGRVIQLRIWQVTVGRLKLYLIDTNDPLNSPVDRGITGKLYGGDTEMRLMQDIVLGIGGWRVIAALGNNIDICHVNEGHAAFAILERARELALQAKMDFWDALWATRAGNIFTTHTPVEAGFDRFAPDLLRKYLPYVEGVLADESVSMRDVLALGRANPFDENEPFNMAYLAQRGSALSLGVSCLHSISSRKIFQPLFPRWPEKEVPVGYITNGVHTPTWDSVGADRLWTKACGKERWRIMPDTLHKDIERVSDEELWKMRGEARQKVVRVVRDHLGRQLRERGHDTEIIRQAENTLDPNALTLGFARRFTEYKRPNLLLKDRERFGRILLNEKRPVQIVAAGKAHTADLGGKAMIREWIELAAEKRFRRNIVFVEDYDIALAQELVQGVDVWINTPRRPWEACGTSGMKVLVNGGLNLSVKDGWWDEAYDERVGWAIGDGRDGEAASDAQDAENLYDTLEQKVVPEFYDRDAVGLPRSWLARIRWSMALLTPAFSSTRMVREYVEGAYVPLSSILRARLADNCAMAKAMNGWARHLHQHWSGLHIGKPTVERDGDRWRFSIPITMGEISAASVKVQLFAEPRNADEGPLVFALEQRKAIPGAANGYIYSGDAPASRPATDFTVRLIPHYLTAFIPAELPLIAWQE